MGHYKQQLSTGLTNTSTIDTKKRKRKEAHKFPFCGTLKVLVFFILFLYVSYTAVDLMHEILMIHWKVSEVKLYKLNNKKGKGWSNDKPYTRCASQALLMRLMCRKKQNIFCTRCDWSGEKKWALPSDCQPSSVFVCPNKLNGDCKCGDEYRLCI